jgi:hypothetical protein
MDADKCSVEQVLEHKTLGIFVVIEARSKRFIRPITRCGATKSTAKSPQCWFQDLFNRALAMEKRKSKGKRLGLEGIRYLR